MWEPVNWSGSPLSQTLLTFLITNTRTHDILSSNIFNTAIYVSRSQHILTEIIVSVITKVSHRKHTPRTAYYVFLPHRQYRYHVPKVLCEKSYNNNTNCVNKVFQKYLCDRYVYGVVMVGWKWPTQHCIWNIPIGDLMLTHDLDDVALSQ